MSNDERERSVAELRRHLDAGRLTVDEFSTRLEAAYAARTQRDLARVLSQLPAPASQAPKEEITPRPSLALLAGRQAGYSSLTAIVCTLVWAFTGTGGDFWPRWVILALAISFLLRVGRAALGDVEERDKLERRFGGTGARGRSLRSVSA